MGTISGHVYDLNTRQPLNGIRVYLEHDEGFGQWRRINNTLTDTAGYFTFDVGFITATFIHADFYRVQAYDPLGRYANVISDSTGLWITAQDGIITVYMTPLPSGAPRPVDPGTVNPSPGGDILGTITQILPLILIMVLLTSVMGLTRR